MDEKYNVILRSGMPIHKHPTHRSISLHNEWISSNRMYTKHLFIYLSSTPQALTITIQAFHVYINIMNMSCLHQPPKYMLHSSEEVENKVEFSIYGTSRDCIISNLLDTFALWYNIVLLSTPLHVFYIYKYQTTYICHTISYICCAYAM